MRVPFGEWLPDQPIIGNPGATQAKNVLPYAQAYGQLKSLSSFTGALTSASRCLGSVWAKDNTGTFYNHAGTATRIEELQTNATWSNVSIAGNYTGVTSWEWAQSGNRLIAVDINATTQYFDLGTSTLYANLAGTPPKAKHIGTVRDFVVMGNVNDGTAYPNRLVWSGYNNTEIWTPSRATQSDVRDLRGIWGDVQRVVSGQYGIIFQQSAVSIMRYSGPPSIFTIDVVEKGLGTPAPNSVVSAPGGATYFLGDDGFYRFTDRAYPISHEKCSRWFFNEISSSALSSVRGTVDPRNNLIIWTFPSSSTSVFNDRILFYNWVVDKWSWGEMDTTCMAQYITAGVTLDGLAAILTDIDAESIPVDSDAYKGGAVAAVAFDTSHQLATFQGAALAAELETMEFGDEFRAKHVTGRPLVSGDAATSVMLQHGYRNAIPDNVTWGPGKSVNARGVADFRNDARFNRIRARITGGFENAIGVDVEIRRGGRR